MKALGRIVSRKTRDRRDSCQVYRTGLENHRLAVQSLLESGVLQYSFEVSRKGPGTSRMALKSLERVWRTAGWLYSL